MVLKALIPALGLIFVLADIPDAECPNFKAVKSSYAKVDYLALKFRQIIHSDIFETVDTVSGSAFTGRGGRFRLELPESELVSNGTVLWSYSRENKQVLVDSVSKAGDWNPVSVLYDPETIFACVGQKTKPGRIVFTMAAKDSSIVPQQFTLELSDSTFAPEYIMYYDDNNSKIEVEVFSFSRKQRVADSLFEFTAPPGVEVIELP
jgi:outer membrane lipoprotein-sorting protein